MKQRLLVGRNIEYGLWEVWPMLWAPKVERILNFIRIFNFNKKAVPQRHTRTHTIQNTISRNISGYCMCFVMQTHVVRTPQNFFPYHNLPNILDCFEMFLFKKDSSIKICIKSCSFNYEGAILLIIQYLGISSKFS